MSAIAQLFPVSDSFHPHCQCVTIRVERPCTACICAWTMTCSCMTSGTPCHAIHRAIAKRIWQAHSVSMYACCCYLSENTHMCQLVHLEWELLQHHSHHCPLVTSQHTGPMRPHTVTLHHLSWPCLCRDICLWDLLKDRHQDIRRHMLRHWRLSVGDVSALSKTSVKTQTRHVEDMVN
jgi:hypothetical protein